MKHQFSSCGIYLRNHGEDFRRLLVETFMSAASSVMASRRFHSPTLDVKTYLTASKHGFSSIRPTVSIHSTDSFPSIHHVCSNPRWIYWPLTKQLGRARSRSIPTLLAELSGCCCREQLRGQSESCHRALQASRIHEGLWKPRRLVLIVLLLEKT